MKCINLQKSLTYHYTFYWHFGTFMVMVNDKQGVIKKRIFKFLSTCSAYKISIQNHTQYFPITVMLTIFIKNECFPLFFSQTAIYSVMPYHSLLFSFPFLKKNKKLQSNYLLPCTYPNNI